MSKHFDTLFNNFSLSTQVYIGFMMTGHTHDDIDQMFSRFTTAMRSICHTIFSVIQLMACYTTSYTPAPLCTFMDGVMDWKSWLDESSANKQAKNMKLHGHLRPHQYHFFMGEDSDRCEMKFKRWARDDVWYPQLKETAKVYCLAKRCDMDDLVYLPPVEADPEKVDKVCKTFKIAARFGIPNAICWQQKPFTEGWGEAKADDPPSPQQTIFCDMKEDKKWNGWKIKEEVGEAKRDPDVVLEEDVETDDENLVYQGPLHSKDTSAPTNTDNFVNVSNIVDEQLILVRGGSNKDEVWLCKVKAVSPENRTVRIHWYAGKSLLHACNPSFKANPKSKGKKKAAKNVPYLDTISFDTILVSKIFSLTAKKSVPKYLVNKAERRLRTADSIVTGAAGSSLQLMGE